MGEDAETHGVWKEDLEMTESLPEFFREPITDVEWKRLVAQKNAEIKQLRGDVAVAVDTIVQQQAEIERLKSYRAFSEPALAAEIERLNGVIASYERDRLYEAGRGAIGSL